MFRFKYYYKDGKTEVSGAYSKTPEGLYNDFERLMDGNEFDNLSEKDMTIHKVLEMAMENYKGFLPDFYKIEIVNDETGEVIDSIEEKK